MLNQRGGGDSIRRRRNLYVSDELLRKCSRGPSVKTPDVVQVHSENSTNSSDQNRRSKEETDIFHFNPNSTAVHRFDPEVGLAINSQETYTHKQGVWVTINLTLHFLSCCHNKVNIDI